MAESGLYKPLTRADKPAARKFQEWVTRDVLPAIRKDGTSITSAKAPARPALSARRRPGAPQRRL
jgi:prophage antirepressor-like protein